jgi:hypothetical protein
MFRPLILLNLVIFDTKRPQRSSNDIKLFFRVQEIILREINQCVRSRWIWGFDKMGAEGGEDEVVREGLGLFVRCVVRVISRSPHGIGEGLPGIFVSNLGLVGRSIRYVC